MSIPWHNGCWYCQNKNGWRGDILRYLEILSNKVPWILVIEAQCKRAWCAVAQYKGFGQPNARDGAHLGSLRRMARCNRDQGQERARQIAKERQHDPHDPPLDAETIQGSRDPRLPRPCADRHSLQRRDPGPA